jgi:hypothetical protein
MGMRKPSQYQVPEFGSFEKFVIEWLSRRDIKQLDAIFQPQYQFVTDDNGKIIVDFVGNFESINADIAVVEKRLGKAIALPHVNVTDKTSGYVSAYKNQEMIDLVAKIYQEDIRMFEYEF